MKKRLLVVALLVCAALLCTAGLGAAGEVNKQVRFANWWGDHEIEIADAYFKEAFTPQTGIEVVFDYIPYDGFIQRMISEIAAGNPADLILCNSDHVSSYAVNGLMLGLNELQARDQVDLTDFYGTPDWIIDGELYGLPSWYGAWYMYVNVTMLEEAGIEVPRGSWTWQELRDICLKVTDPEKGVYGLSDGMVDDDPMYWYMLNGGAAFTDDMSACTINSPEVVEAMKFVQDLIYVDKAAPEPSFYATTAADQFFRDGKAAFHYNGTWAANYFRVSEDVMDFEWDVIFAPTGPSAPGDVTPARSSGMFIPVNAKDVEASWTVMKQWGSLDGINHIDIGALSSMPSSEASLNGEVYNLYPEQLPQHFTKEFFSAVTARAKYFPFTHYVLGENVLNAMQSLSNIWVENMDAQTVCDEAYNTIQNNFGAIVKVG